MSSKSRQASAEKQGGAIRPAFSISAAPTALVKKTAVADITPEQAQKNIASMTLDERSTLATIEPLPQAAAQILISDRSLATRTRLARNKSIGEALMLKLTRDPQYFVRDGLLDNEGVTAKVLEALVPKANSNAFRRILEHDSAPQSALVTGAESGDPGVREAVANSKSASPELLDKLSTDENVFVRAQVANNPNTSDATVAKMSSADTKDDGFRVYRSLSTRPKLPDAAVANLLKSDDANVLENVIDNNHDRIPAETLVNLIDFEGGDRDDVLNALLRTKKLPQDKVDQIFEKAEPGRQLWRHASKVASPEAIQSSFDAAIKKSVAEEDYLYVEPILSSAKSLNFGEILDKYAANLKPSDQYDFLSAMASNEAVPADVVKKVFRIIDGWSDEEYGEGRGRNILRDLMDHPNLPQEVVTAILKSKDDRYDYVRNGLVKKLPVSEQVRLSSKPPEWFTNEPERNIDYKRYQLRQLWQAMEHYGVTSLKKADLNKENFSAFKGKPAVEDVFKAGNGVVTKDFLANYMKEAKAKGQGYYIHHSQYSADIQSDAAFRGLPRYVYAVGLKDIETSPEVLDFVERVAPTMQHSGHSIGVDGKNLGWILYKKVPKDLAATFGIDQEFFVVEQVQSDWRGFFQKIRDATENMELDRAVREDQRRSLEMFEDKYGEDGLARVQKELDKLVSNYPEKILSAFLEDVPGELVFMTGKDRIRELTRMSPTTAKIIYDDVAKRFGFKDSERLPGYMEVVAKLKAYEYQDDVTEVGPIENNYSTYEQDSNFSVKNRPRPTRKEDKHVKLDSKVPTGEREPVDYDVYTGLGNLMYPLGGSLETMLTAAVTQNATPVSVGKDTLYYEHVPASGKQGERLEVRLASEGKNTDFVFVPTGDQAHPWKPTENIGDLAKIIIDKMPKDMVPGEKVEPGKDKSYNVLKDPALAQVAGDLSEQEKMFVGITQWKNKVFVADPERVDDATLEILKKNPVGDGKYFKWIYTTQEDIDAGKAMKDSSPSIYVEKKDAWDKASEALAKARETQGKTSPLIKVTR